MLLGSQMKTFANERQRLYSRMFDLLCLAASPLSASGDEPPPESPGVNSTPRCGYWSRADEALQPGDGQN